MTQKAKLLAQMRRNPGGDWRIEQIKILADDRGIRWRQPGTSHVTFVAPDNSSLTIPAHKPIKPVYIRKFLQMLDALGDHDE